MGDSAIAACVIVCGDRDWADDSWMQLLMQGIFNVAPELTIVHGDARGADKIAGRCATKVGLKVEAVPADWMRYGRAAGPIRNREMLKRSPAMVLAHHDEIWRSRGTKDMCRAARAAGVPVLLFYHPSEKVHVKCQYVRDIDLLTA